MNVLAALCLKAGADVLEDPAHDRAKEDQGDDHDDGDEGEQKTVLNERLTFLVLTLESGQKSADEVTNHVWGILLSSKDVPAG